MQNLSFDSLEKLTYKLRHEFYEEGQFLFRADEPIDKVLVLANGLIEVLCPLTEQDIILDTLSLSGCVLGQFTALDSSRVMTFSARAKVESNCLVLHIKDIEQLCSKSKDLENAINEVSTALRENGHPLVDYQIQRRRHFKTSEEG